MEDFVGIDHSFINLKHHDMSSMGKPVRCRRERREKEELPPPLPLRASLRRYHTCDGRLVIESGRLPEILCTHRENSRLTIDLISLEDDFKMESGDGVISDDRMAEEDTVKIYKNDYGVNSGSCMVGFAVPAIRHVRI